MENRGLHIAEIREVSYVILTLYFAGKFLGGLYNEEKIFLGHSGYAND